MECKFNTSQVCPMAKPFERWENNKRETALLTLGLCPECPIYRQEMRIGTGYCIRCGNPIKTDMIGKTDVRGNCADDLREEEVR